MADGLQIEWDSAKDKELWDILSQASAKGRDLDWNALADRFDVTLAFLSQQAAWLYEKQLSQVRAQLRNVNKPSSAGNSPTPGSVSGSGITGGHAMSRAGSGGARVPSSLSNRPKERTVSYGEDGADSRSAVRRYTLSRNTSTTTVTQSRNISTTTPRSPMEGQPSFANRRQSREARRSVEASPKQGRPSFEKASGPSAIASESSGSSESEALHPMVRSRAFARRPRYSTTKAPPNPLSDADEEEEDLSPFLPFSSTRPKTPPLAGDPGATVKISPNRPSSHRQTAGPSNKNKLDPKSAKQPVHSSSSSAQSQPQSRRRPSQTPLSALSPKQRRAAKEGSDGTPSMGSSFSDLDDASVTQSALEEALANEMTHGGVASRMSTISQALKSRYL